MHTHKLTIELLILALLIGAIAAIHASGQSSINVITTATPFLRVSADARAAGMAETALATSADANSAQWNPAKLAFAPKKGGLAGGYAPWLHELVSDMYRASLAGYQHLDETQTLFGSLQYFSLGGMKFTDENGNLLQSARPREWAVSAGYTRKLSKGSSLGLTLKYIHSSLASKAAIGDAYKPGRSIAMDLGYYYQSADADKRGWCFGAALTNLGTRIAYSSDARRKSFLPANLGLGAAYHLPVAEQHRVTVGLDINKLLVPTPPASGDSAASVAYYSKSVLGSWFRSFSDAPGLGEELREYQVSAGVEYWYRQQFALRAGYCLEDKTKGDRSYASVGAGLRYEGLAFHFAYLIPTGKSPFKNPLANTLRFGIVWEWAK